MKAKYIVYGDCNLSANKVARCFRVNPKECIFINKENDLRGINESDYIPLRTDYKGRYNLRAWLLTIRTLKNYDECTGIIEEYDKIINTLSCDTPEKFMLVSFVISNLSYVELRHNKNY